MSDKYISSSLSHSWNQVQKDFMTWCKTFELITLILLVILFLNVCNVRSLLTNILNFRYLQFNGLDWRLLVKHLDYEDMHNPWLYIFSKDKINLLHPGRKGFRLNLLEHLEIRRGLKTANLLLTTKLFLTVPFYNYFK